MYKGLGQDDTTETNPYAAAISCPFGVNSDGSCVIGPPSPVSTSSGSDISEENPYAEALAAMGITTSTSPTTAGTSTTPQTFAQWVQTNSTLLMVAFGAFGAFIALMSFASGKK